ncbi:hypothetical protein EV356DRAFT_296863 [Viridothelium virens]|uniref:Uncharacterized protein n=1 Tax=Viridothelium virens TaxID=1048519 RepID=A0A6A6GZZ7_VIRVR|nr:hypothetical protein EV356DRAFT_296863 [Viridothelium virens]
MLLWSNTNIVVPTPSLPKFEQAALRIWNSAAAVTKDIFESLGGIQDALAPTKRQKAAKSAAKRSRVRVEETLELIWKIREGEPVDEGFLIQRQLNGQEYQRLLSRIAEDHEMQQYFLRNIRYDYTHETKVFAIRMGSYLHNGVSEGMGDEIQAQLRSFRSSTNPKTAELCRDIKPYGDVQIKFGVAHRKFDRHCPDRSYKYKHCYFPGLVNRGGLVPEEIRSSSLG